MRFRGPSLASPLPGAAEANFRNGWYYPGEIARLDEAGYIFLQGRTSDVILRNGAKVYPAEVEGTLLEHAGVLEVAVIGERRQDDLDTEETVIAFVVPRKREAMKPGATAHVTAGDLLVHCRMRLSPHKVPRRIHLVEQLPKNAAGKIDKIILAKYLAGEIETF